MNKLLPLILLCTLLCGCGQTDPSEKPNAPIPTESVVGDISQTEGSGGRVHTVPLNLLQIQGLRVFGGNILLFSGGECTTLTLLDGQTLETFAVLSLDFHLAPEDPSLVLHPSGRMSFFDSSRQETLLLDNSLQEVTNIPAPGALSGCPILSADETTLFYCTPSHVRAWDLESGIRRCITEMASSQELTGVHRNGTILQCRIAGDKRTLFLSVEDGRQLHTSSNLISLAAENGRYFALVSAGAYCVPVFGTDPAFPMMLPPQENPGGTFFLPEQMAAVTVTSQGSGTRLDYCRLSTGLLTHRLALAAHQRIDAVEQLTENTLVLLIFDTSAEQSALILWEIPDSTAGTESCPTMPYRTADSPDTDGLARCMQTAQRLSDRYGIRILLGEDAVAIPPLIPVPEMEHLVPILQRELVLLEQRLAGYPDAILQDTAAHFSSLTLCLVRSLPDDGKPACMQGTHFLDGRDAYLVIPTGPGGDQALYHQLFHLMEIRIFSESKAFDQWDTLNPAGFRYDYDYAANALRDSGVYLFERNRSFVDTFSMSYPKEDRARIMEYAMLPEKEAMFHPPAMQEKLRQLCTGIRDAYDLTDPEAPLLWEQYLE